MGLGDNSMYKIDSAYTSLYMLVYAWCRTWKCNEPPTALMGTAELYFMTSELIDTYIISLCLNQSCILDMLACSIKRQKQNIATYLTYWQKYYQLITFIHGIIHTNKHSIFPIPFFAKHNTLLTYLRHFHIPSIDHLYDTTAKRGCWLCAQLYYYNTAMWSIHKAG